MKTTKRILSLLLCMVMILGMIPMIASAEGETVLATFNLPDSGKSGWQDGEKISSTATFTNSGYTLTVTNCTNAA